MKKKDIITLVISLVVIAGCGYYLYTTLVPKKNTAVPNEQNIQQEEEFTGEIDEKTLEEIKKLSDYGEATLENIGRANPFGPIN